MEICDERSPDITINDPVMLRIPFNSFQRRPGFMKNAATLADSLKQFVAANLIAGFFEGGGQNVRETRLLWIQRGIQKFRRASPPRYPRYNRAMEQRLRDLKTSLESRRTAPA